MPQTTKTPEVGDVSALTINLKDLDPRICVGLVTLVAMTLKSAETSSQYPQSELLQFQMWKLTNEFNKAGDAEKAELSRLIRKNLASLQATVNWLDENLNEVLTPE